MKKLYSLILFFINVCLVGSYSKAITSFSIFQDTNNNWAFIFYGPIHTLESRKSFKQSDYEVSSNLLKSISNFLKDKTITKQLNCFYDSSGIPKEEFAINKFTPAVADLAPFVIYENEINRVQNKFFCYGFDYRSNIIEFVSAFATAPRLPVGLREEKIDWLRKLCMQAGYTVEGFTSNLNSILERIEGYKREFSSNQAVFSKLDGYKAKMLPYFNRLKKDFKCSSSAVTDMPLTILLSYLIYNEEGFLNFLNECVDQCFDYLYALEASCKILSQHNNQRDKLAFFYLVDHHESDVDKMLKEDFGYKLHAKYSKNKDFQKEVIEWGETLLRIHLGLN